MIGPEDAAASAPCSLRSRMATFAPCLAKRRAVANPIPRGLAAPEMTAVLPSSNIVSSTMSFDFDF